MIKSMTGYGRAERQTAQRKIVVEIKSLNSKQLDLSARIPSMYREREYEIRSSVGRSLSRGKVDLFITYESEGAKALSGQINAELFEAYYRQITNLASGLGYDTTNEPLMQTILRMPEVLQTETVTISKDELASLDQAVAEAIENINAFRLQEGAVLMTDMLGRVAVIESLMMQVIPFESERIETVRTRLQDNLSKQKVVVDNNRFEQEIIYFLEKFDITEEKVRLKQHCDYFRQVATTEADGVGRKLGFISQEIGREINTMGSKANHAEIQRIVVQMKDELEKIKEQLLNIL